MDYYTVNALPYYLVDGVRVLGNDEILAKFNEDLAEGSPFVIDVAAEVFGDSVDLMVEVYADDEPGVTDLALRIAVCETGLYYPNYITDLWNHVLRTMIPDVEGIAFEMSQGDTMIYHGAFRMQPHWDMMNMRVIAFVQSDSTRVILQGGRWIHPQGTVRGVVMDQSQTLIRNALVAIPGTQRADSTDNFGRFTLHHLVGAYEVETLAVPYYPDTTTVEIYDDSSTTIEVYLTELPTGNLAGNVTDSGTGEGIEAKVVILMKDEPWDSSFTDPLTGSFEIHGLPISCPRVVEYNGIRVYPEMPYPVTTFLKTITVVEEDTATTYPRLYPADVLLVDDDEGMTYENYYIPAIDSSGRTYVHLDAFRTNVPPAEALSLFQASTIIVWYTGDATVSTLIQEEQDSLMSFLDRGGNLFLTGQNIAEELTSLQSPFLDLYLHTSWIENSPHALMHGNGTDPIIGRKIHYLLTGGTNGANNQYSRDRLEIKSGANEIVFSIADPADTTHLGIAGIWTDGPVVDSKIVFFGFGFEAVNKPGEDDGYFTRRKLMKLVLDYLDPSVGVQEPEEVESPLLPKSYVLSQNYPNPFNPFTTIRYELSEETEVHLKIFNVRGQPIRLLVNEKQSPDTYRVSWDGKNDRGVPVSSGVYFYLLKAGGKTQARKMILLK